MTESTAVTDTQTDQWNNTEPVLWVSRAHRQARLVCVSVCLRYHHSTPSFVPTTLSLLDMLWWRDKLKVIPREQRLRSGMWGMTLVLWTKSTSEAHMGAYGPVSSLWSLRIWDWCLDYAEHGGWHTHSAPTNNPKFPLIIPFCFIAIWEQFQEIREISLSLRLGLLDWQSFSLKVK